MTKEQRTLKEIISYLVHTSNALETIRKKVSRADEFNFRKAQEYLAASIQHLERGNRNFIKHLTEDETSSDTNEEN